MELVPRQPRQFKPAKLSAGGHEQVELDHELDDVALLGIFLGIAAVHVVEALQALAEPHAAGA